MKKKFLKYGFVAAFALVAGYSVYASQQKVGLSNWQWRTWKRWLIQLKMVMAM